MCGGTLTEMWDGTLTEMCGGTLTAMRGGTLTEISRWFSGLLGNIGSGAKVLADPALAERMAGQGAEPAPSTPDQLAVLLREDLKLWQGIVKASGATID
jgi:tripartite-type tricarboxylate transporter receptor subunit TctC